MEKVTLPSGRVNEILIKHFPALDGWEIQLKYRDFVRSEDKDFRRKFTMEVLSHAEVVGEEINFPLQTDAIIDNHLGTWQNVQQIFDAVLSHNGIDPNYHAEKANHWAQAGSEFAIGFVAEATKLIGPAFDFASRAAQAKEESK